MGNSTSNNSSSNVEGDADNHSNDNELMIDDDPFDGLDTLGYRVLGVQPNSPASRAGLVSFLDFLVGANQRLLLGSGHDLQDGEEYDDVDLPALLEQHVNEPIEFLVYNIKRQQSRLVELTPSNDWGGAGLLGVTIRLDNYAGAETRLIRVLSVAPKSPADLAGLVPLADYLLGTTQDTMESTQTLATILQRHQDQVVELYVYNADADKVRVVALLPTLSWGGPGLLGAEVGVGYLHRLPASVCDTKGASVERKVRYVTAAAGASRTSKNTDGTSRNNNQRLLPQLNNNAGSSEPLMVEITPQLEMETEPSSHSDDDDDSSAEDMTSVSLRSQRSIATDDAAIGKQQQQTPVTPMTSVKAGRQTTIDSPMTPATLAPAQSSLAAAAAAATSSSLRNDSTSSRPADIFSKPAPMGNTGLPPPPKRTAAN